MFSYTHFHKVMSTLFFTFCKYSLTFYVGMVNKWLTKHIFIESIHRVLMLTNGRQIAAARQLLGWSQADLAEKAGISKPSVIRIEKDLNSVKYDVLSQIQHAIEQNNIEFLEDCGVRESKQTLKIYRGQSGFREFYDDLYDTAKNIGGDICLFNGVSDLVTKWLGNDFVEMHKKRMIEIKQNFNYRIIVEEGDTVFFGSSFCTYKSFPKSLFNNKTIYIYSDKVAFLTFRSNELETILLKQKDLADCQRLFFNLAWDYIAKDARL